MTAWRRVIELSIGDADVAKLTSIARSRTELASRVERARILLAYREDPSFFAVARALGLHHQTVQRCIERALAYGPFAALDDRPRPGKEPKIAAEAKAWLVSLACRKAKDLEYPHEFRRDPEFKEKMAEVLCVYRQVKILEENAAALKKKPSDAVAIISYDKKPGHELIAKPIAGFHRQNTGSS
jgi:transposase